MRMTPSSTRYHNRAAILADTAEAMAGGDDAKKNGGSRLELRRPDLEDHGGRARLAEERRQVRIA